nr:uncharacterized protein LOC116430886 [Nomia melanderi]
MSYRPECRKYRQWKREQAKKARNEGEKRKEKKRKEKKVVDCVDEEEDDSAPPASLKVNYLKCKKKKIRRKSKKQAVYVQKRVSVAEIVLKRIQPSMEVRELLLNPRHTGCLRSSFSEINIEMAESARSPKRRKGRKRETKKDVKDDKSKQEEGRTKQDTKPKLKDDASESKRNETIKAARTKEKGKKNGREMIEDSDKEIFLAVLHLRDAFRVIGVKLTAEDRKKIKQHQREVEDANAEEKNDKVN